MANNSYDFNNTVRDVSRLFDMMVSNPNSLLSMVPISFAQQIQATKYEWINDTLSPVETTITGFDTDGDGTGVNVASTVGIVAGSILRFSTSVDVTRTELVQVTSVDSATDLTVVRDYGGTTGVTLVVGDKTFLVSSPKNESSAAGDALLHQGVADYNYTEIFDEMAEVSKTSNSIDSYDDYTRMPEQERVAMQNIAYKLESALIHGVRVQRTSSVQGTMQGLNQFINVVGGNIESSGGAISQTIIDNALELIYSKGGDNQNLALVCNINQARKISDLAPNPTAVIQRPDSKEQRLGNFVSEFVSSIPLAGGLNARIFTNQKMHKDQVLLLDMSRIAFKILRPMNIVDATPPGTDAFRSRLITELTLELKNAKEAHAIITGLNV